MSHEAIQPNKTLIASYVHHEDRCFFVSTIDRNSSAMTGGRYAETLVWEYDWAVKTCGKLVGQDEGPEGSIKKHLEMCQRLLESGQCAALEAVSA